MKIQLVAKPVKILDFDIECRPLSWYGGDFVTKEITAIACQFTDESKARCWLLGKDDPVEMLEGFRTLYNTAAMVTGHYIRGYDLSTINAAMVECELPVLGPKLTHDTKLDLVKWSGLSKSQENIAAVLGLKHPKIQMDQAKWREANRLSPRGLALTRKRVVGDVKQHIEMRAKLLELGFLGPPRTWTSRPPTL